MERRTPCKALTMIIGADSRNNLSETRGDRREIAVRDDLRHDEPLQREEQVGGVDVGGHAFGRTVHRIELATCGYFVVAKQMDTSFSSWQSLKRM